MTFRSRLMSMPPATRILIGAAALVIFASPLLVGATSTRTWTTTTAHLLTLLLFWFFALERRERNDRWRAPPFWWVLFAAAIFTMVQIIPLPADMLAFLSPAANDLYRSALESNGLYGKGQWRTLSLDPAETWRGASAIFGLVALYLVAANAFSRKPSLEMVSWLVAVAGFTLALIGFVHKALAAESIYGLVDFPNRTPFFFSTFVNANHLAAFLNLAVPLQVVFALKAKTRKPTLVFSAMAIVTALAIFLTLSRAGIAAFALGQLIFVLFLWRRRKATRKQLGLLPAAIAAVIGLAAFLAVDLIMDEFLLTVSKGEHINIGALRTDMWPDTIKMIELFPLTGIGAEAFKVAYPIFKSSSIHLQADYPENILLQLLVDYGLIVGISLLFCFICTIALLLSARRLRRLEIAATIGLLIVALQNIVDFNLTAYGVSVPFFLLMGIVTARHARHTKSRWLLARHLPHWLRLALIAAVTLIMIAGEFIWLGQREAVTQTRLHQAAYASDISLEQFETRMAEAFKRHPFDYYLRLLAAERYRATRPAEFALKQMHLKQAKRLNPSNPDIDRMMARAYARNRMWQASRAAYASTLAKSHASVNFAPIWDEMRAFGLTLEDIVTITPREDHRIRELARYLRRIDRRRAFALLNEWTSENHLAEDESYYLTGILELDLERPQFAERIAQKILNRDSGDYWGYRLLGDVALQQNRLDEAARNYKRALDSRKGDADTMIALVRVLIRLEQYDEAASVISDIHALPYRSTKAQGHLLAGDLSAARKRFRDAVQQYRLAEIYDGPEDWINYRMGVAYERLGDATRALKHYEIALEKGIDPNLVEPGIARMEKAAAEIKNGNKLWLQ